MTGLLKRWRSQSNADEEGSNYGGASVDGDDFPIPRASTGESDYLSSLNSFQRELATECSLCHCKLGKRQMKPRHHCRICLQAVCNTCSPNVIQFEGQAGTHRACKSCAINVQKAPAMRSRLESVAEKIGMVSGSHGKAKGDDFTFAGNMAGGSVSPRGQEQEHSQQVLDMRPLTLEDAVTKCEFAASSLMSAFHSHQSTKLKIVEVEAEIGEQRMARERLETVAKRVDEAENEAAEERQARKQLEAKERMVKKDCVRLADHLCTLATGAQAPARTASIEDAIACGDSAVVRIEAQIEEDKRAKKELEHEKNEVIASKDRLVKGLQAEVMKLRSDVAHERKLREAVQENVLDGKGSYRLSGSISPRSHSPTHSSASGAVMETTPESDRLLFHCPSSQSSSPGAPLSPARTPPTMRAVREIDETPESPDNPDNLSLPSSSSSRLNASRDDYLATTHRPSCAGRLDGCKLTCVVS